MNEVSSLIKESPEGYLVPSTMTQLENTGYEPGRRLSAECKDFGTLLLKFIAFRIVRNTVLLFISYSVFC